MYFIATLTEVGTISIYDKVFTLLFHPALSFATHSSSLKVSFWQSMRREPVGGEEPSCTYAKKLRFRSLLLSICIRRPRNLILRQFLHCKNENIVRPYSSTVISLLCNHMKAS